MELIRPNVKYKLGEIREYVRQWTAEAYTNLARLEEIATKSTKTRESKFIQEEVSPFCLIAEFMDFPDEFLARISHKYN